MSADILHTFYCGRTWRAFVFNLKIERGFVCERCGKVFSAAHLIGHHKTALTVDNVNDVHIALNPDNIEIVCLDCHNKEHNRFGYYEKKVYLIYGSPLSGKTTAVQQMIYKGDIVLDIDKLWQAVTFQPSHIKPNNVRFNIFALRDNLYDQIKTRYGKWNDAYIIGGYPDKYERERTATELGAELLYIESTKAECLQRRIESGRPAEYDEYINKWWGRFIA